VGGIRRLRAQGRAELSLTPADVALLALAAVLVGFAKTALGGVAAISVAIFAAVLPARESTGTLLPLLVVGDLLAVGAYRRHADWKILLRLFPAVGIGVLFGAAFVGRVDDLVMRRTIGAILVLLVVVHVVSQRRRRRAASPGGASPGGTSPWRRRGIVAGAGLLAGFTTMVANSGGAVMSLYLLSTGLAVLGFLGTTAWFFLLLNLFKLPFSVGLGLLDTDALVLCAALSPAVLLGAVVGRRVVSRISQARFESTILVLTFLSGLNLLR